MMLDDLCALKAMMPTASRKMILLHTDWKEWLLEHAPPSPPGIPFPWPSELPVQFSRSVPKFATRWQFPADPHWIWEPEDEQWCRFFSIGKEVETDRPAIFVVPDPFDPFLWPGGASLRR